MSTLALARALIACSSITPDDAGCQKLLADRLEKLGFQISHYPFNGVSNLWAKRGTGAPHLCFAGHTDVVPPGEESAWHSPPFVPTIKEGYLCGRGAADMKSSLAAMVVACERFITHRPNYTGTLSFLVTSDEEGEAKDGTVAVLNALSAQGQSLPQMCVVGEASSVEKVGDVIKIGRRGSLTGHLRFQGKQAHVAYPEMGKNPIHHSFAPLLEISSINWGKGTPDFPPTTLQFSQIQSGVGANNVIPPFLTTTFNLRFSPDLSAKIIQEKIENILHKHGCEYTLNWTVGAEPFLTDPKSELVNHMREVIHAEKGSYPRLCTKGGTSDGRFFAKHGCQVIELGPCNATIHQVNERIAVASLEELTTLYERTLHAILL